MPISNVAGDILSNSELIAMLGGVLMGLEGEDAAEEIEDDDDDDDERLCKTNDVEALRGKFLSSA